MVARRTLSWSSAFLAVLVFGGTAEAQTRPVSAAPRGAVPAPGASGQQPPPGVRTPPMTQVASAPGSATVIFAITQANDVAVKGANGIVRRAKAGEALVEGDEVMVAEGTSVVIELPDGSRLRLGKDSQLKVGKAVGVSPSFDLGGGTVRGTTSEHHDSAASEVRNRIREQLKGKHLLYIRTKSAVLGVRGTDFVVGYDAATQASEFHTLQGTVEVGQSIDGMNSGRFMRVGSGRFVKADATRIYRPQRFDPDSYLQNLKQAQPGLVRGEELGGGAPLQLLRFRASGVFAQNDTGDTMTGQLTWNPWYRLTSKFGVGLGIGGSMYKGVEGESDFLVIEGGAWGTFRPFKNFEFEAGGGVQSWADRDMFLMFGGGVSWFIPKWLPFVDRVFAGYRFVDTTVATSTFVLGAGLSF